MKEKGLSVKRRRIVEGGLGKAKEGRERNNTMDDTVLSPHQRIGCVVKPWRARG